MFSNNSSHSRSSSKGRYGKKSNRGLSVATSEDSGCELIIRPSSSGSSDISRANSKASQSSRGSFRDRFRRGGSKKIKGVASTKRGKVPPKLPPRTVVVSDGRISPPAELRLKLLPRIAEYRERGWISRTEEEKFMKSLSDQTVDFETTVDHAALEVEQTLDQIRNNKEMQKNDRYRDRETESRDEKPSSIQTLSRTTRSSTVVRSIQEGKACIAHPSEVWDANEIESKQKLEEMFVAMCFFARLGFIQPPSCLRCAHRESMHDQQRDTSCKEWVAWRKNAKSQLHPDQLEGNVVMVQCHAARSLVKGEEIQGYKWDKQQKLLKNRNESE